MRQNNCAKNIVPLKGLNFIPPLVYSFMLVECLIPSWDFWLALLRLSAWAFVPLQKQLNKHQFIMRQQIPSNRHIDLEMYLWEASIYRLWLKPPSRTLLKPVAWKVHPASFQKLKRGSSLSRREDQNGTLVDQFPINNRSSQEIQKGYLRVFEVSQNPWNVIVNG